MATLWLPDYELSYTEVRVLFHLSILKVATRRTISKAANTFGSTLVSLETLEQFQFASFDINTGNWSITQRGQDVAALIKIDNTV